MPSSSSVPHPADAVDRFADLLAGPEDELPLDRAALLIAACANPALDVTAQLARLDELAARCERPTADALVGLLFGELGLRGNRDDYQDPRNSYLDQVLDRGLGIPISLSLLTMEVGRRAGLVTEGIGMPGHFLVRVRTPAHPATGTHPAGPPPAVLLDAFDGGAGRSTEDCRRIVDTIYQGRLTWSDDLLDPTPPRSLLDRMLANLAGTFTVRHDTAGRRWVAELRAAIPGRPVTARAALAEELAEVGRFDRAAGLLEELAGGGGLGAEDTSRVARRAETLRARCN